MQAEPGREVSPADFGDYTATPRAAECSLQLNEQLLCDGHVLLDSSLPSPLLSQPNARPAAVLGDEFDGGLFEDRVAGGETTQVSLRPPGAKWFGVALRSGGLPSSFFGQPMFGAPIRMERKSAQLRSNHTPRIAPAIAPMIALTKATGIPATATPRPAPNAAPTPPSARSCGL